MDEKPYPSVNTVLMRYKVSELAPFLSNGIVLRQMCLK